MGLRGTAALLAALLAVSGCGSAPPEPAPPTDLAQDLAVAVTGDGVYRHLQRLQEIADQNGDNRADGSPGYQASLDYVVKELQDKGFEVQTAEFERLDTISPGAPTLTAAGRIFQVDQASLLRQTPSGGLSGSVVLPTKAAGCARSDYPAKVSKGAVAVADETGCSVVDKTAAAAQAGAAALVVISDGGRNGSPPNLFPTGYYRELAIPVAVAGSQAGAALRRTRYPVKLVLDTVTERVLSRNVLAQTKTGSTNDVVMVGAHLDGVANGPGINDNGSGVAAVLETALQLGPEPAVTNSVRFAFWGAEEDGLAGSLDYVFGLDREQLNAIALYLNFDMLGSPNAGYFTYDGDQSGPVSERVEADSVPIGSAGIERTLAGYLNLAGKRPADMPLGRDTDYSPFLVAGVPFGGMTTGARQIKSATQARLWGGEAGVAFDPNYHSADDNLAAVNRDALAVMGPGVAYAVGTYADSIDGVNGVPAHDKRHRPALKP